MLLLLPTTMGMSWQAVDSKVSPPRSGHTAAYDAARGQVWLFGGYAEYEGKRRQVTNDVWCYDDGWTQMLAPTDVRSKPRPRLCSASAIIDGQLAIFGGWDPEKEGTGGTILDDVWTLDLDRLEWARHEPMPRGPCSRHVAVDVAGTVVVHTFRCEDSVLVWDDGRLVEQRTSGQPPSSRGLHSAAAVGRDLVVFGGADKKGDMRSDVWALDTKKWTWRQLAEDGAGPTARAGSCASSFDSEFIVCCGAERTHDGGLVPRADVWTFDVPKRKWTQRHDGDVQPRNAASLSGPRPDSSFLLHGGWHPFLETYSDSALLTL